MTNEQAIHHLAATYQDWIGYDPFEDDPAIPAIDVARTLEEYANEAGEALDDETALAIRTVNENWK